MRYREAVLPINNHNASILNEVKLSTKVSLIPKSMPLNQ